MALDDPEKKQEGPGDDVKNGEFTERVAKDPDALKETEMVLKTESNNSGTNSSSTETGNEGPKDNQESENLKQAKDKLKDLSDLMKQKFNDSRLNLSTENLIYQLKEQGSPESIANFCQALCITKEEFDQLSTATEGSHSPLKIEVYDNGKITVTPLTQKDKYLDEENSTPDKKVYKTVWEPMKIKDNTRAGGPATGASDYPTKIWSISFQIG